MAQELSTDELKRRVEAGDTLSFYNSRRWRRLRKEILKRDHNDCQRCLGRFMPKETVELKAAEYVHHIIPLKEAFELAFEPDNLISLCFSCHEEVEGRAKWNKCKKKERLTVERW